MELDLVADAVKVKVGATRGKNKTLSSHQHKLLKIDVYNFIHATFSGLDAASATYFSYLFVFCKNICIEEKLILYCS